MPLTLALCCNDPDNGNFEGYAESIEIHDVELEGPRVTCNHLPGKPPKGSHKFEGEDGLRVGRCVIPCLDYKTWYGNWCWDAARVRAVHALRVLNYLVEKRGWHCVQAGTEIFEAINERHRVTVQEWKRYLAGGEE